MTIRPPKARSQPSADTAAGQDARLYSPVFDRNARPIVAALAPWLEPRRGGVLEIGSGPGQHVAAFAAAFPSLDWQPSDPEPAHLASIRAWASATDCANLRAALALDATADWAAMPEVRELELAAVYAQNVLHIAPWAVAEGLIGGAGQVLPAGGLLILYGPFAIDGIHTGPGNAAFDRALKTRDPAWGVRDLDAVAGLAREVGFGPPRVTVMPADNRLVVFEHR